MYKIILLIVVICIVYWFGYNTNQTPKQYSNLFLPLDLELFRSSCGETILRIEKYFDENNDPTLYATNRNNCSLNYWFDNIQNTKGYMSKLKFTNPTNHTIGKFVNKWIESNKSRFPKSLQTRIDSDELREYSIKLTNGKWRYPDHFDCSDNYLMILAGTRQCKIDQQHRFTLSAGDMFYIPAGTYHEFWCDSNEDELNILVNIDFASNDAGLKQKFEASHPEQIARLSSRIDYT